MAKSKLSENVRQASRQEQFLNVIDRDEATRRFQSSLTLKPLGVENIQLDDLHGRVLAHNIQAKIDVPGFDRSNVDGFAVIAEETAGAQEETPCFLKINNESLLPGQRPNATVTPGTATPISTGGMVPRGANAIVMIEETDLCEQDGVETVTISRSVAPGNMITYAGTDIAQGETVLWGGTKLTSREIGLLASLGQTDAPVFKSPRVAIISTGDEVVAPGETLPVGSIYDSNAAILSAAVKECGGTPVFVGRVQDEADQLQKMINTALEQDVVLLSGGTSKGAGDISYRIVQQFNDPGIVAHGVALKPGKPICMAVTQGKPVVILPGFPTSAIFTFHEFVAPVIRKLAGQPAESRKTVRAKSPIKVNSDRGRTEYLLVRLFESDGKRHAYPMGKGSGSVTTFSLADGFLTIPQHSEIISAGTEVEVTLLDEELQTSDLVVIGSHCVGLDLLLGKLRLQDLKPSIMHVGSEAGLSAVQRGECHLAGVHLLHPETNIYNVPFLTEELSLIKGYRRMQSFVCRSDDERFSGLDGKSAIQVALNASDCSMVNRNPGSGTRILTDQLLQQLNESDRPPHGYAMQVKSHNAVAAAIRQQRADWGIAIDSVANDYGLQSFPLREEHFDFIIRKENLQQPQIVAFQEMLQQPEVQAELEQIGFQVVPQEAGFLVNK
ncbi:molybdopterin biosynthesis protein [Thalassoglobus polymorphus]|uniref:Molybdopterin molybdenumtransferase n=1 Tax=Thalassoglobus polymorphus TaxID=2527994 RepID=A0A517QR91_9PLAN|nr:molybdopterin biosynthesis protein [Thalassoglobus polymorphus]QDT34144.1 Molybdopterin molybdenumtransferase [Thalassoglobus polymorphus]